MLEYMSTEIQQSFRYLPLFLCNLNLSIQNFETLRGGREFQMGRLEVLVSGLELGIAWGEEEYVVLNLI